MNNEGMAGQNDKEIEPVVDHMTLPQEGSKTPYWKIRGPERVLRDGHFWFAGDAIIIHDDAGRIVDCNEQATKSLDYPRDELMKLNIADIAVLPEDDPQPWNKIPSWGKNTVERLCKRKDGSAFPVEISVRHEIRKDRSLFISIIRDITLQKKAEEKIRNLLKEVQLERERLLRLVDSMSDEVWFTDERLKVVFVNSSARKAFGEKVSDIDINDLLSRLDIMYADGRRLDISEAPHTRALVGETVRNFEERIRVPETGTEYYKQISASPVRDAEGRIMGTVSVVRDLTSQRLVENMLMKFQHEQLSLLDLLPIGVSIMDDEGNIIKANRALERIFGLTQEDLFAKKYKGRRYLREDGTPLPDEEKPSRVTLRERKIVENMQVGIVKEDGSTIWALVSSAPLPDGGAVVLTKDFSRQKRTIQLLDDQAREVNEANAALRVLLQHRDQDRQEVEQNVMSNISKLVMPHLDMLDSSRLSGETKAHLEIIRAALNSIVSSFSSALSHKIDGLSPKELQIAHMVKEGRQDKDIAELLHLSEATVRAHRRNIRKKLGITKQKVNLRTFLAQQ